jgi:hypothetical protein
VIILLGLALLVLGMAIGRIWQLQRDLPWMRTGQAGRVRDAVSDIADQRRLAEDRMYRAVQERRPR